MFANWEKSLNFDITALIGIGLTLVFSGVQLIRTIYGQGKAKAREEYVSKNLELIHTQLNNHITDLGRKVDAVNDKLDGCQKQRADYRVTMEGRVSKVEAKLEK